jgi:hypothetical protein
MSSNSLIFTGINFLSNTDYTATAVFKSQTVTVLGWSSTSATAVFTNGIPSATLEDKSIP